MNGLYFHNLIWISSRRNAWSLTLLHRPKNLDWTWRVQHVIREAAAAIEPVHSTTIAERNSNVSRIVHFWIICRLVDFNLAVGVNVNTSVDKAFPPSLLNQLATVFWISRKRGLLNEVRSSFDFCRFSLHLSFQYFSCSTVSQSVICETEYSVYNHAKQNRAYSECNVLILRCITRVKLYSHAENISEQCIWWKT